MVGLAPIRMPATSGPVPWISVADGRCAGFVVKALNGEPAVMRLYDALGAPAGEPLATARLDAYGIHQFGWVALEEPWRIRNGLYVEVESGSIEGYVFRDDSTDPADEVHLTTRTRRIR